VIVILPGGGAGQSEVNRECSGATLATRDVKCSVIRQCDGKATDRHGKKKETVRVV
jgi:hypothetical protein